MDKLNIIIGDVYNTVNVEYVKSIFMIKTHNVDSIRGLKYKIELTMPDFNTLREALKTINSVEHHISFVNIPEYDLNIKLKTSDVFVVSGSKYSYIRDKSSTDPVLCMELIVVDE